MQYKKVNSLVKYAATSTTDTVTKLTLLLLY